MDEPRYGKSTKANVIPQYPTMDEMLARMAEPWTCIRCGNVHESLPDGPHPEAVQNVDVKQPNGDYFRYQLGQICGACMKRQPDTSGEKPKPVMHSMEYLRRMKLEEDMTGIIIADCVPQTGVHDTTHPAYVEWENNRIMVQVAEATIKTAEKRGVRVVLLTLERGDIRRSWTGDPLI